MQVANLVCLSSLITCHWYQFHVRAGLTLSSSVDLFIPYVPYMGCQGTVKTQMSCHKTRFLITGGTACYPKGHITMLKL